MNKKLTLAAISGAAAMAFAQGAVNPTFLWDGTVDTQGQVETGSTETETSGYWYEYTDKDNDGASHFTWPSDVTANEYDNFFGPLIEAYQGIKGSVALEDGYEYPFAGLGFNIWSGNQEGVDITAWGGICLTYQSTTNFAIELGVEDEATVTEYNNYKTAVSKNTAVQTLDFPWAKFKQESGWGVTVAQATVLAKTSAIKLKFSGSAGTGGDFLIQKVGSNGMCSGSGNAIKSVASASSVKAQLSGRVLSFQGFSSAKAEVINLQGQVVKSATVSSAMDLSSLDAGVYMVRVAGKNVSFAQKIVLE